MQLREMIEIVAAKMDGQKNLAKVIGVNPNDLSSAKTGKRGLPAIACGKLAEILEIDRWTVVAASELVTERSEEKRAYFSPFVLNGTTALASAITALMLATAPNDSYANDTLNMSQENNETVESTGYMGVTRQFIDYAKQTIKGIIASGRRKLATAFGRFRWKDSLSAV